MWKSEVTFCQNCQKMADKLKLERESINRIIIEKLRENQDTEIKFEKELAIEENYDGNREVKRFIKIFNILIEENESPQLKKEENNANEGGRFESVVVAAKRINQLLKGDIDDLNLSKITLKTLRALKKVLELTKNAKNNVSTERQKTE